MLRRPPLVLAMSHLSDGVSVCRAPVSERVTRAGAERRAESPRDPGQSGVMRSSPVESGRADPDRRAEPASRGDSRHRRIHGAAEVAALRNLLLTSRGQGARSVRPMKPERLAQKDRHLTARQGRVRAIKRRARLATCRDARSLQRFHELEERVAGWDVVEGG